MDVKKSLEQYVMVINWYNYKKFYSFCNMIFNERFDNLCPIVMYEIQLLRLNSGNVDIYLKRVILSGV